jgi:protein-S-isoprenylcysteine O-methyltransferase Ste14
MTALGQTRTLAVTDMPALRISIFGLWAVFWIYWLISAVGVKEGSRRSRPIRPVGLLIVLLGGVTIRALKGSNGLAVDSPTLEAVGVILLVLGLGLAVWARVHLGRNWGMPMTEKAEPELITSGPYRFVRHPIYSGLLLGLLGTALATNLYWFIAFGAALAYFAYSASVEERLLTASFPRAYPTYRAHTKMLIPFVL